MAHPYCLKMEVTATIDPSENAINGVLSQEEHPVIYMSNRLSGAESCYSNIERKALAILYVIGLLRQILLGRKSN